jgi:hypothetical protein
MSFEPPVLVKDEPHRLVDTITDRQDSLEFNSFELAEVAVYGDAFDIPAQDLAIVGQAE